MRAEIKLTRPSRIAAMGFIETGRAVTPVLDIAYEAAGSAEGTDTAVVRTLPDGPADGDGLTQKAYKRPRVR